MKHPWWRLATGAVAIGWPSHDPGVRGLVFVAAFFVFLFVEAGA